MSLGKKTHTKFKQNLKNTWLSLIPISMINIFNFSSFKIGPLAFFWNVRVEDFYVKKFVENNLPIFVEKIAVILLCVCVSEGDTVVQTFYKIFLS